MLGALRQQAIDEGGIDPVGREHCVGDALRGILVEIQPGRSKRQVEVCDDAVEAQVARDRPGDIVGNRGGADAALGSDHGDDPADRLGIGRAEQSADGAHNVEHADGRDQVIADASTQQLAVEHDVVVATDNEYMGAGVAYLGKQIEARGQIGASGFGLNDDDVGTRRVAIRLYCRLDAAHLHFEMGLAQTAILAGRLNRGGGLHLLAEGVHRHARRGRNMLVGSGRLLHDAGHHLPRSLILP